jgi:hypothetical protein
MITGPRKLFIGGHVTPKVKDALKKRAMAENKTVSLTIYELLKKALRVEEAA